jgi:NAD-dependent SIR2 family protein deacetylase
MSADTWKGTPMDDAIANALQRAADAIGSADALVIGAGAGMGVDSGLPDFRGAEGFWRAYPPYAKLGLDFPRMANPHWFSRDPHFAWGFYGHRLGLYRKSSPHSGFSVLRRWADRMTHGAFIFTSNVDGHFQRAGFSDDRILEQHGAIEWNQCLDHCGVGIFPANQAGVSVDAETFRAAEPLPRCPRCDALARPNILMFDDFAWESTRSDAQEVNLREWFSGLTDAQIAVIECGAGPAIPTVRNFCERIARVTSGTLIRINPRDCDVPHGQIAIATGAQEALHAIDERVGRI